MNIAINTKYDVGDTIWFADYFYDTFFPCKCPAKISEINIEIDERSQIIYYWTTVDYGEGIVVEKFSEAACFHTYEECTKWCEEQNKKIG